MMPPASLRSTTSITPCIREATSVSAIPSPWPGSRNGSIFVASRMRSSTSGQGVTAMDDLLQHFIVEARELIQQATDDLLALERDPTGAAHMDSAFRAVHTLKGSVGLFDFAPMGLAL